jgi:hypothetical protein
MTPPRMSPAGTPLQTRPRALPREWRGTRGLDAVGRQTNGPLARASRRSCPLRAASRLPGPTRLRHRVGGEVNASRSECHVQSAYGQGDHPSTANERKARAHTTAYSRRMNEAAGAHSDAVTLTASCARPSSAPVPPSERSPDAARG